MRAVADRPVPFASLQEAYFNPIYDKRTSAGVVGEMRFIRNGSLNRIQAVQQQAKPAETPFKLSVDNHNRYC
jgi:hypothetical protein